MENSTKIPAEILAEAASLQASSRRDSTQLLLRSKLNQEQAQRKNYGSLQDQLVKMMSSPERLTQPNGTKAANRQDEAIIKEIGSKALGNNLNANTLTINKKNKRVIEGATTSHHRKTQS